MSYSYLSHPHAHTIQPTRYCNRIPLTDLCPFTVKPRIDRATFKTITIKTGRTHKWAVDVTGEPAPTLTWSWRDDIPLVTTDRIKIDAIDYHTDFSIVSVTRKDTGKYTLTAVNENGKDAETVELIVLGKPGKPRGPLKAVDVHATGLKLKWQKPEDDGGVPIKEYEIEKMDKATGKWVRVGRLPAGSGPGAGNEPEFEVTGLTEGAEYEFRVTAVNDEGDSEPLLTEHGIVAKNPFDQPGKPGKPDIADYDQQSVTLKWQPPPNDGGAPILKYIIQKKDKFKPDWENAAEIPGDGECSGKVDGLKETGEYQFRIIAVNKAGPSAPSDASKSQICRHRALKPRIDRTNLKVVCVRAGKAVKFDVDVRGEPAPTVTWWLKDAEVQTADNIEIVNVDYNTKLSIVDAVRKNTGLWKVRAVNAHGQDEADVEITILSAPGRPGGPMKITDVTKGSAKVKWQKPDDDGGKPITAYQVEKLDKATGKWVPVGRVGPEDLEMDVRGLQEGHEYAFRVKAVNEEGESEPLESSGSVVAKNPFDVPGKPGVPELDDWDVDRVDLKWAKPKSDGGAPITGYVIEKKEKFAPTWEEILTTHGPETKARVPGLKEGNVYQFRVRAVNKAGPGEAGDATQPHTAKARFCEYTCTQIVCTVLEIFSMRSETADQPREAQRHQGARRQQRQVRRGRARRAGTNHYVDVRRWQAGRNVRQLSVG